MSRSSSSGKRARILSDRENTRNRRNSKVVPMFPAKEDNPRSNNNFKEFEPLNFIQGEYHRAIKGNDIVFGIGSAGTGKAQPLNALIKVPGGWSRMGDMKIGTRVIAKDGSVTTVNAVYPQGQKEIFRITFADGRSTECCAEHLWSITRQNGKEQWFKETVDTSKISEYLKTYLKDRIFVDLLDSEQNEDIELPIDPYLLGVFLGDGSSRDFNPRITTPDEFIIKEITSLLPKGIILKRYDSSENNGCYTYVFLKEDKEEINILKNFLLDNNLNYKLSYDKTIPEKYLYASTKQRLDLLQGLLDTDGTIDKNGTVSFCSSSQSLSLGVQYLVRSLGGLASISLKSPSYTYLGQRLKGRPAFQVNIRYKKPSELFRLPKKKERANDNNQYAATLKLKVLKIESIGIKEAQCISIEHPEHLYVTNQFIVTHNTHVAAVYAATELLFKRTEKIILTRPNVETGRGLGFLPGTLEEKYAPYLLPFDSIFTKTLGKGFYEYALKNKDIEPTPLGFLRGTTFENCIVLIDEAQNCTKEEMKMLLSRIGKNCKMIISGDTEQSDIEYSGLDDAVKRLTGIRGVEIVRFMDEDIVRSRICKQIIMAYRD